MQESIVISEILAELKTNRFLLDCEMAMGYVPGLPLMQIRREQLCLLVPFLRYQLTGRADQTLVYPIRYTVTLTLPEKKPVAFSDLRFDSRFEAVQMEEPVGLFRHRAIRHLSRSQYRDMRHALLKEYDKVANTLLYSASYSFKDEQKMRTLLQQLLEPSLLPMYRVLDDSFCQKYLL